MGGGVGEVGRAEGGWSPWDHAPGPRSVLCRHTARGWGSTCAKAGPSDRAGAGSGRGGRVRFAVRRRGTGGQPLAGPEEGGVGPRMSGHWERNAAIRRGHVGRVAPGRVVRAVLVAPGQPSLPPERAPNAREHRRWRPDGCVGGMQRGTGRSRGALVSVVGHARPLERELPSVNRQRRSAPPKVPRSHFWSTALSLPFRCPHSPR